MIAQPFLFDMGANPWHHVTQTDPRCLALVNGGDGLEPHYSRQSPESRWWLGNGRSIALVTADGRAVWGVTENHVPDGDEWRFRCVVFRNEGAGLSSDLIRWAVQATYAGWRARYRSEPRAPMTTEVNPRRVRAKRDPGRCFIRAGWRVVRVHRGLVVLEEPTKGTP